MNIEIKGVHGYSVSEKTNEHIEKKLKKFKHAGDLVQDFHLSIEREKNGEYKTETNIHFRWGAMAHLKVSHRDLYDGLDILFDKAYHKISKEKEKIQDHKGPELKKQEMAEE